MKFNDNQPEILSQAVRAGLLHLPVCDFMHPDVEGLIGGGFLVETVFGTLVPTPYGRMVVQIYQREVEMYQRGWDEGFRAGLNDNTTS